MKEIFELLLVHFPFIDGETEAQRGSWLAYKVMVVLVQCFYLDRANC